MISVQLNKIKTKTKKALVKFKSKQHCYEILIETPDIPKIPIKTYHWEDLRRSRKRGAYPWTHLTKPPYDDDVDAEEYTMDAFRRSRSTSTLGKSETHEITDIEEEFDTNNPMSDTDQRQFVSGEDKQKENIPSSTSEKKVDTITIPKIGKGRAKSEEPTKKRKLSIESSYSRISLPKLKLMDKLKSAKDKIKVPKRPRQNVTEAKQAKKTKITEGPIKTKLQTTLKNNSPVYIHIPLKPPPGQTDEFSKFEFESPSHSPVGNTDVKPEIPESTTLEIDNTSIDDNISQYLDKEDPYEVIPEKLTVTQHPTAISKPDYKPGTEKLRKLEGALSKWKQHVPKNTNLDLPPPLPVRAKSEEPKRKRKSSIDSSYSRKSLSKLAFLKKIKQTKEKIKLPKFRSFSKSDEKAHPKVKETVQKPVETHKKPAQPEKPVYIHIPLKPPPGKVDEFSYLVNEPVVESPPQKNESTEKDDELETPEPDSENNVQLIILTPPSDDEILDSAGPETPSETDQKFFENLKIDDLKTLAKNAVDTVYPDLKKLETVQESEDSLESSDEEREQVTATVQKHQILVDEEDGLKLSETAIAMINEELEKEYRQQAMGLKSIIKTETSPVLKKKVSFKRKSRQEGGERIYEDVQLKKDPKKIDTEQNIEAHSVVIPLESFQSMSVDEEKSYLDKQLMKTTSLEEDYNKWSKSNDHEYEPIDPPPEVIIIKNPPIIHDNDLPVEKNVPTSLIRDKESNAVKLLSAQELQKNMEDRYFRQPAESPKPIEKGSSTLPKASAKIETGRNKGNVKTRNNKNFNETLKLQADKLKSKMRNIKRPSFTLPQRPKFPTTKLKKPNFKMPKLPDRPTINLPSFNFSQKSSKDTWRERQLSTESNAGDSKKNIFDFRTYPRMFNKSKKENKQESTLPAEFATMPRTSKTKSLEKRERSPDIIRIPLHPEDDIVENQKPVEIPQEIETEDHIENEFVEEEIKYKQDSFEYKEEDSENSLFGKDFLKRWEHGQFHENVIPPEEDHDKFDVESRSDENVQIQGDSFDITPPKDHSSESLSEHRRGVLEEIDSDEFFLREKGISQEDIEFQSEDREYDMELSDQSEPIRETPRRKPLRKPKRKKTPHVSREQISFDRESYNTEPEEYNRISDEPLEVIPPIRPKRRISRKNKKSPISDVIPYQETIPIDDGGDTFIHPYYADDGIETSEILPDNILSNQTDFHYDNEFPQLYENEHMRGIEQPEITVSHTYYRFEPYSDNKPPVPPTRRQRSLRSLSASDQDSLFEESKRLPEQEISAYLNEHEYIIPTPEPVRPRRTRSRTRSRSVLQQEEDEAVPPIDQIEVVEVIEEPCLKDTRDTSGYAVIDKSKVKEPPLPPSRFDDTPKTPPRKRRNRTNANDKFATVPRLFGDEDPPRRPLRNYSTLRGMSNFLTDEEKENLNSSAGRLQSGEVIQKMRDRPLPAPPRPPRKVRSALNDISHKQNIMTDSQENMSKLEEEMLLEIEGQIEQYDHEETITHGALVLQTSVDPKIVPYAEALKTTKSDDETPTERVIPITRESDEHELKEHLQQNIDENLISQEENDEDDFSVIPDEFNRLKSPGEIDVNEFQKEDLEPIEKTISISVSEDVARLTEDSEVPEEFFHLKSEDSKAETNRSTENQHDVLGDQEINVLKAQKLQVCDLDVDKLRVRELQAGKIIVSELDGVSLQVSEINSKCGNLVVSGIDLPPNLIQEMLYKLQLAASEQALSNVTIPETSHELLKPEDEVQKKTPIEELEEAPPVPPRYDSRTNLLDEVNEPLNISNVPEELLPPPIRPPRRSSQVEKLSINAEADSTEDVPTKETEIKESEVLKKTPIEHDSDVPLEQSTFPKSHDESSLEILEPTLTDVLQDSTPTRTDEQIPPTPLEPPIDEELSYEPSNPPPTFFALKSPRLKEYFDEHIPIPSRRKRRQGAPPVSGSSSDDVVPSARRHHRPHDQTVPQLAGQLVRLCAVESERSIKRLITHIMNNVLQNADGKQDLHVIILLLLILIAGLLLLSEPKVTIYQNQWDFFNPPTDT
ncbi:hypothetical protein FQR65_LT00307 [Abscondita terminalis]|nr:hypothetical protein FQR65_LT00307 [Abscondita terminalis]